MNIDDIVKKINIPEGSLVEVIFKMQKELMVKYDKIEEDNGFQVPEAPYNLDNHLVQGRLKDMFWRVAEELSEAVEVLPSIQQKILRDWTSYWDINTEVRHFFEEMADALHFLVEASIISDLPVEKVISAIDLLPRSKYQRMISIEEDNIRGAIASVVFQLGITANILKNKPWKCTQMSTDIPKFKRALKTTWQFFTILWGCLGCSQEHIFVLYAKKNLVNQWRQKTNY